MDMDTDCHHHHHYYYQNQDHPLSSENLLWFPTCYCQCFILLQQLLLLLVLLRARKRHLASSTRHWKSLAVTVTVTNGTTTTALSFYQPPPGTKDNNTGALYCAHTILLLSIWISVCFWHKEKKLLLLYYSQNRGPIVNTLCIILLYIPPCAIRT